MIFVAVEVAPDDVGVAVEEEVEFAGEVLDDLSLAARLPPTAPPTVAPIMIKPTSASIVQNVRARMSDNRLPSDVFSGYG